MVRVKYCIVSIYHTYLGFGNMELKIQPRKQRRNYAETLL